MLLPDETNQIADTDVWRKLSEKEKTNVRRHQQAWQISQFLHGEQGALVCTAKIVQQVPHIDSKFYAATQVVDEARHVEAYAKLLNDKFELAYPITTPLRQLLDDVIQDRRWDFTYLGMQVMIEGLALAAFHGIRSMSANPLAAQVNAYVMQDEARHVAFGRLALKDYYPELTEAERTEREEFVIEASYHMRDRFTPYEVWEQCGLPVDELKEAHEHSEGMLRFRHRLFSRIVPTVKQIGLWGPKVRDAYDKMGLLDFAALDADAMFEEDARVADMFDQGLAPQQQGKGNMAAAE
jgi:hypothetical protein